MRARGVDLGLAVGEHRLDQLELGDRLAELLALDRVAQRVARACARPRRRRRRRCAAAPVEHLHRGLEALALAAADQVRGGHATVLEDHVAGVRAALAHLLVGLAERDARRAALDDERRDAAARPCRAGSVRAISVKMPACGALVMKRLVPLSDVVVAVARARVVRSDAASEPASGSVSANEPISSPLASRGSQRASAPRCRRSRCPASRCRCWCRSASGTPARCGRARRRRSTSSSIVRPRPPYSSGIDRPNRPSCRISSTMSSGIVVGLGDVRLVRAPAARARNAPPSRAMTRASHHHGSLRDSPARRLRTTQNERGRPSTCSAT